MIFITKTKIDGIKVMKTNPSHLNMADRRCGTGNMCLCTFLVESVDGQQSPPSYWQ